MQRVLGSLVVVGLVCAGQAWAAEVAYRFRPVDIAGETGTPGEVRLTDLNRWGELIGNSRTSTAYTVTKRLKATPARCPDDVSENESTTASAINNLGQVVGVCVEGVSPQQQLVGFIRGRHGAFTFLRFPGADATIAAGINDRGEVVGQYGRVQFGTSRDRFHGFVWRNGQYETIDAPFEGAIATNVTGINNAGQMIGTYEHRRPGSTDPNDIDSEVAFLIDAQGTFTELAFPGAVFPACCGAATLPMDINNKGQVLIATYDSAGVRHFALYQAGHFGVITGVPEGATDLEGAWGLNDLGALAGTYVQSLPCATCGPGDEPGETLVVQSFLATPVPPQRHRVQQFVQALKARLAHERHAGR